MTIGSFTYLFSFIFIQNFQLSNVIVVRFCYEHSVCMCTNGNIDGDPNTRHDSVFIANWKLKNLFSAQCAYSFTCLSFLSNVCGRVFALTIQFVYNTDTSTHSHVPVKHTHTNILYFQLVQVCIHAFTRFYRHTQTETHAIMATATVFFLFIYYYQQQRNCFKGRKKKWIKNEWTRLLGRFDLCALKHVWGP